MTEATPAQLEDRRVWWERRRLTFSLAVAACYAATVVAYELFTPWWAGDHIGLSPAALMFFYAPGGLIWVGAANAAYALVRFLERIAKPVDFPRFRRRAFGAIIGLGAASPAAWLGGRIVEAWLRHL